MKKSPKPCVFCSVIAVNIPHHEIIWKGKHHIAFLDINPLRKGHLLVVPKKHSEYLFDGSENEYLRTMGVVRRLAKKLKLATGCKKVCVIVDGFSVDHLHIHLIPISRRHELEGAFQEKRKKYDLKRIAEKFRKVF